jgi:hypothetical protein
MSLSRFNASLELTLIDIFDLRARMKIAQVPFPQRCMLTRLRMRVVLYPNMKCTGCKAQRNRV